MEEAPENGMESSNSADANGMNELINFTPCPSPHITNNYRK